MSVYLSDPFHTPFSERPQYITKPTTHFDASIAAIRCSSSVKKTSIDFLSHGEPMKNRDLPLTGARITDDIDCCRQ